MLGYMQNYQDLFTAKNFWGALCFLSTEDLFVELGTANGDRLVLIGAHPTDPATSPMGGRMDTVIAEWVSQVPAL